MNQLTPRPFPGFGQPVPLDGYSWWYIDAVSEDGTQALTLIAFIGSVFSPYYARARGRGPTEPLDHCAVNIALYRRRGKRWAMTERPAKAVSRSDDHLQIGPSSLEWNGEYLDIRVEEWTVPLPTRIRGRIRLWPTAITDHDIVLDTGNRHHWRPLAPCAHVDVSLSHPATRWSGNAYWDCNTGSRPLERDFVSWDWSRSSQHGGTAILYDIRRRDGDSLVLALHAGADGSLTDAPTPEPVALSDTLWRVPRRTHADRGEASVLGTLEDTPFYARSLLQTRLGDQPGTAVHESLSLDRFRSRWVRSLLPFRMPRARR